MTDPTDQLSKLLDPAWIKQYAQGCREIAEAMKDLGPDGFKKLTQIEIAKIEAQSKAKIEEIQAGHQAKITELDKGHEIWLLKQKQPWSWRRQFLQSLDINGVLAIFAIAIALAMAIRTL